MHRGAGIRSLLWKRPSSIDATSHCGMSVRRCGAGWIWQPAYRAAQRAITAGLDGGYIAPGMSRNARGLVRDKIAGRSTVQQSGSTWKLLGAEFRPRCERSVTRPR